MSFHDSEIICRCKQVSAAEVRAAIRSDLGARTVDGVKRRVSCGMGRCQGGFCQERVLLLMADELQVEPESLVKDRSGSWIIKGDALASGFSPLGSGSSPKTRASQSLPQTATEKVSVDLLESFRLLIIGGGAAGLSAALAAKEAGLASHEILVVDRLDVLGGILPQCTHHGFGEREHGGILTGSEFLAPLLAKFEACGIPTLLNTTVTHMDALHKVELAGPAGKTSLEPEAVVFAAGCREQAIGSLPIAGTRPSGIFTAGAAQRMVNLQQWDVGERIVILGSGDVGMIMAGTLSGLNKHVLALVEQAEVTGGLKANRERYVDALGIPLLTQSTITQIFGHTRIEGVELCTNGVTSALACDTLIVSVGLIPETDLLQNLGAPPWLLLAGNARRVHSFIEGVVQDGRAAGTKAARLICASRPRE